MAAPRTEAICRLPLTTFARKMSTLRLSERMTG